MLKRSLTVVPLVLLLIISVSTLAQGLQRNARSFIATRGDSVTPAYEGWYPTEDGTIMVSFGYFNRNQDEIVDIPLGPDNQLIPAGIPQVQPTSFNPRRAYGTFAVAVPQATIDAGEEVWWTMNIRGDKVSIPANMSPDFKIDALGPTANGNTPPRLRFSENGPEAIGPGGASVGPLSATVGRPLRLEIWVADDGVRRERPAGFPTPPGFDPDAEPVLVTLNFVKHQAPVGGEVSFSEEEIEFFVSEDNTSKSFAATFDTPGNYKLRILSYDATGINGNDQCCWSNAYVDVVVTP